MRNPLARRVTCLSVTFGLAAAFVAGGRHEAQAIPCDPSRDHSCPGPTEQMGTVEIDALHTVTIDQGGHYSASIARVIPFPRRPVIPPTQTSITITDLPSWATAAGGTITISPTAPEDATADVTVSARATMGGGEEYARGSVTMTVKVRGVDHINVTNGGATTEGQEKTFLTPCGSPAQRVNLLVGSGVTGPLKLDLKDVPSGVTPSLPSSVNINGQSLVHFDMKFATSRSSGSSGDMSLVITPAHGSPSTLKIPYRFAVGHVESMSPSHLDTAQHMKPGTTVTLHGQGFCSGTRVTVGNDLAAVDGKDSDDGTTLTFAVPALATSGTLGLKTRNGAFTDSVRINSFRNVNGFSFSNTTQFQNMVGGYNISDFPWGFSLLDPVYLAYADAGLESGQCFGFALTALRFADGEYNTFNFPGWNGKSSQAAGAPIDAWHLMGPGFSDGHNVSPNLAERIHRQHLWQIEGHVVDAFLNQTPTARSIKEMLSRAFQEGPGAVISMFDWSTFEGHAVLAYDVRDTNNGFEIMLYDPNRPFLNEGNGSSGDTEDASSGTSHQTRVNESRILVSNNDTYSFDDHGTSFSGSTHHLTILPMSVFDQDPEGPATGLLSEIFGGATGARVTQVRSPSGRTLMGADGKPNLDPATSITPGRAILPMGGLGTRVDPLFVVDGHSAYTVTYANESATKYTGFATNGSLAVSLADTPSTPGAIDTLQFDPVAASVQISSSVAKTFAPHLAALLADKTSRHVTLHTSLAANARGTFSFDSARNVFTYVHTGPSGNISATISWDKRPTANLTTSAFNVDAGDTVTIAPSWDQLEAAAGQITVRKSNGATTSRNLR